MKTASIFVLAIATLTAVSLESAPAVYPRLTYSVSNAVSPHPGALPPGIEPTLGVAFSDRDLCIRIELAAEPYSDANASTRPHKLALDEPWWRELTISLAPLDQPQAFPTRPITIRPEQFTVVNSLFLKHDAETGRHFEIPIEPALAESELARLDVRVGGIPPGDYTVQLTLPVLKNSAGYPLATTPRVLSVRGGHENGPLQRMYLMEKKKASKSFDEFREIQMKLIELDPDAWRYWEELGNASLAMGPGVPAEALAYYERASAIHERVTTARPDAGPTIGTGGQFMRLYKQLYPLYESRHERLKLVATSRDGIGTFKWVDRKTGEILGYVDPSMPALPTALESPK